MTEKYTHTIKGNGTFYLFELSFGVVVECVVFSAKPHRSHQSGRLTEKSNYCDDDSALNTNVYPIVGLCCKNSKNKTREREKLTGRRVLMDQRDTSPPGRKRSKKRDGSATTPGGERRRFHLVGSWHSWTFVSNLMEINEHGQHRTSMRKFRQAVFF